MRAALTSSGRTVGEMVLAAGVAAAVAVVALIAISRVQWPAYPSSNQLHALTTVGQVGCLAGLLATGWVYRRGHRWPARLAAPVFISAFSVVTLGMPLGATKLYLFGISVDQQFRTEYLTRLTDSAALRDMTYLGLPPFYPPGWFWLGGRAAALTDTPGWAMFKPWAIVSITIAVAVAWVLWQRLIRFEFALAVTAATAAVTLAYSSPEPYAAMITVLIPPVLVLAWSGLRAGTRGHAGWAAVIATGVFLGFAATFYTLLVAYSAFTVTLMALGLAVARARGHGLRAAADPLARLGVIGVIALALAATTWLPFLLRAARDPISNTGSAQHYLPADGAELTFPMLQFTLLGALCLLGTLWLVVKARTSVRAAALGVGVASVYLWSLLSMLTTLARTTLLSFRLQSTLTVLLTTAGVFAFIEVTQRAAAWGRRYGRRDALVAVATVIGCAGAVSFSQDIPNVLRPDLTVAYTDTDGDGQRGDRRPPGSERYYARLDDAIMAATGVPRDQTVVLTADYGFLALYPYFGFQGLTSHYANPLAQFDARAAEIESWEDLKTSAAFTAALDRLPWAPPTVFVMRRGAAGAGERYTLRLAEDVYPNHPNVRRYTVDLSADLFDDPQFEVSRIGPFVLAVRVGGATR
ncbi:MAG TPA: galactan 5-O-arabinofuranosyltransferase [Mycolicibacillus parakoreensis]|nr:galactan 5-O-arabinofuranosyltransferase [Mycolicibacillus parakoreensis]